MSTIAALTTPLMGTLPELRPREGDAADATRPDGSRAEAVRPDGARAAQPTRDGALAAATIAPESAARLAERAGRLGPLTYGRGAAPAAAATVAARGLRLDVTA